MGSSLSPIIANIFMEAAKAVGVLYFKHEVWSRYVNDTFIIWPHGRDELDIFLEHLNNILSLSWYAYCKQTQTHDILMTFQTTTLVKNFLW